MTDRRVSRRGLLTWLIGGSGVLVGGGAFGVARIFGHGDRDDDRRLAAVRRIGEAYLDAQPDERSEGTLHAALPSGWEPPGSEPTTRLHELQPTIRADFARGDTIEVGGWRLSHTEARASALVALRERR